MSAKMKTQEVAALLNKSGEQVRRYAHSGLLTATQTGKELIFDRDEVIAFANARGVRIAEREVPQGSNFTDPRQAQKYLQNFLTDGVELLIKPSKAVSRA